MNETLPPAQPALHMPKTALPSLVLAAALFAVAGCVAPSDGSGKDTKAAVQRVYALEHADAVELAATLREFLDDAARVEGAPRTRAASYDVQADVDTSSIRLTAPPERMAEIETLITALDRPSGR